jgi:hypothetical protein
MSRTTYRLILLLLGLALIAVVIGAVLFAPAGDDAGYPPALERVEPIDGSLMFGQPRVVVDLEGGYRAQLTIDDVVVPEDQVSWTEATGLHVFEPGPGKVVEVWPPGFHVVSARWDRVRGLPDPGMFTWSFRVQ